MRAHRGFVVVLRFSPWSCGRGQERFPGARRLQWDPPAACGCSGPQATIQGM